MSVTTAIPQPSEPKPVPNLYVRVMVDKPIEIKSLGYSWYGCHMASTDVEHAVGSQSDPLYVLPGTALAAALAELERASVQLEEDCDYHGKTLNENVAKWLNARRKVRDLLAEGRGK